MTKKMIVVLLLIAVTGTCYGWNLLADTKQQEAEIALYVDLGIIQCGNTLNASGERDVTVLCKPQNFQPEQISIDQNINSFEQLFRNNRILQNDINKRTNAVEPHLLVYDNRMEVRGYRWIPLSEVKEYRNKIKEAKRKEAYYVEPKPIQMLGLPESLKQMAPFKALEP